MACGDGGLSPCRHVGRRPGLRPRSSRARQVVSWIFMKHVIEYHGISLRPVMGISFQNEKLSAWTRHEALPEAAEGPQRNMPG